MPVNNRLEVAIRAILVVASSVGASVAHGQTLGSEEGNAAEPAPSSESEGLEAIVVTGSRIARPNYDTVEPTIVVSSESIEARGFETLGQALNEQPAFGVPGASPVGGQSSFGQGQSFVNFLGLGSQRTLTLVNGRRFVGSNTSSIFGPTGAGSQVDLNVIPTKLVDRVETIAVGGAPIYGSDAISGTINIILKKEYEGFELDAQHGISSRSDAGNDRFRALFGKNFADGRGNFTIAAEVNRGEGLIFTDRAITNSGLFFRGASDPSLGFRQELYSDRRIPSIAETGIPYVGQFFDINLSPDQLASVNFFGPGFDLDGDGNSGTFNDFTALLGIFGLGDGSPVGVGTVGSGTTQLRFDESGNLIPIDFGRYAGAPGSFGIDFEGGNGFSLVPVSNLLSETRRANAIANFSYEISDSLRMFGEAWFARSRGTNLRDQPVYNTGLFDFPGTPDGSIILSVNNPFLSPSARSAIVSAIENNPYSDQNFDGVQQDYFYLGRANTDLQSGRSVGEVEVKRFVLGFAGELEAIGRTWSWEVAANYGRSTTRSESRELIQQNFSNAVDAVLSPTGSIVCRPGAESSPFPSINPDCAPLNLFGTNLASQAALDYVTAIAKPKSLNEQKDFTAFFSGALFELPGGDFSVSLGYQHREESQDFDPGSFFFGADDPNPLVDTNGDGDPTNDRQSYGRSVPILPVFGEFKTNEVSTEFLAEIISPSTGSFLNVLEVRGAARYVDNSLAGGDLTWTLGGRVGLIPDFTLRGNFTRAIRAPAITELFNPSSTFFGFASDPCDADNRTSGPDPATRQANCAAAGLPPTFSALSDSRSFLQAIEGNPVLENETADSWTVGIVIEPRLLPQFRAAFDYVDIELTSAITSGGSSTIVASCYDSTAYPDTPNCERFTRAANGQLNFIQVQYLNLAELTYKGLLGSVEYQVPQLFGGPGQLGISVSYQHLNELSSRADAFSAPSRADGGIGYAKQQGVLSLNYNLADVGIFAQASYIGGSKISVQAADDTFPDGLNNLSSRIFTNLGATIRIGDSTVLRAVVDNVFDTKPPYPYPASGGTTTYFRGVLGRYFRIGATYTF